MLITIHFKYQIKHDADSCEFREHAIFPVYLQSTSKSYSDKEHHIDRKIAWL